MNERQLLTGRLGKTQQAVNEHYAEEEGGRHVPRQATGGQTGLGGRTIAPFSTRGTAVGHARGGEYMGLAPRRLGWAGNYTEGFQ